MKTTKPHKINYAVQYKLMRTAAVLMPLLPAAIVQKFCTKKIQRMEVAEKLMTIIDVDRYDMVVDWGCVALSISNKKIS